MGKLLRVNMTDLTTSYEETPEEYKKFGGRGLSAMILNNEIDPACEPLGKYNKLILAPGLLGGTPASNSGRLSVGGKSPLTGGIKEANGGGTAAQMIAKLDLNAIIVEGKAADKGLYVLKVDKNGAELIAEPELREKGNYDTSDYLRKKYGEKIGIISVGPGGERGYAGASVAVTDMEGHPTRHAARGGLGAVMGVKGLKAVVVDDKGTTMRQAVDKDGFRAAVRDFTKMIRENPRITQLFSRVGTLFLTESSNTTSTLPTRNFSAGRFEGIDKISSAAVMEKNLARGGRGGHSCMPGCAVQCSVVYHGPDGKYLTAALEYETMGLCGSNLGLDDPDYIAMIDRLCDDTGVDTIEMGGAIGVAMEAGLLEFGDGPAAVKLMEEVFRGTTLGRVIGNGALATGKIFNVQRVAQVKGQGIPSWEPRGVKGTGTTYATSPMGADHTAGAIGAAASPIPTTQAEGQGDLSRNSQIRAAMVDTVGFCSFSVPTPEILVRMLNTFHGWELTNEAVLELGRDTIKAEREFNERAGFTKAHDRLPEFIRDEPLGPVLNTVFDVPEEELEKARNL